MADPRVTIVVSPRERFSYTRQSLESIYEHTAFPFKLVYVDGGSPASTKRYLQEQASAKGFKLIRKENYLSPNQSRNIGLQEADTEFVVFIDNDVVVTPGWLAQLVQCADETGATVVGPLVCQEEPVHEVIHCAGGEARVLLEEKDGQAKYRIHEKIYKQGRRVAEVRDQLRRESTELAEFHCMMVRRSIFEQIGALDEKILNTREHVDFCMTVLKAGGTVYLEPDSVVTYVPGPPLELTDMAFYMLRWSDEWELISLQRLRDKWNLTEDEFFKHRYRRLGWRRHKTIVKPLISQLSFGQSHPFVERVVKAIDRRFNRYLTHRYMKQYLQNRQTQELQLT